MHQTTIRATSERKTALRPYAAPSGSSLFRGWVVMNRRGHEPAESLFDCALPSNSLRSRSSPRVGAPTTLRARSHDLVEGQVCRARRGRPPASAEPCVPRAGAAARRAWRDGARPDRPRTDSKMRRLARGLPLCADAIPIRSATGKSATATRARAAGIETRRGEATGSGRAAPPSRTKGTLPLFAPVRPERAGPAS